MRVSDGNGAEDLRHAIMKWELDHVFLTVSDLACAERLLSETGMTFTERRVHRGQGTANACANFENAFFELLGAHDIAELQSDLVRPLGLDERIQWRRTGACPFGICLRPSEATAEVAALPFQTWAYAPPYVAAGASIPIVTPPGRFREPLVFLSTRPRGSVGQGDSQHRDARRTLTGVRVTLPQLDEAVSKGVGWLEQNGAFLLKSGPSYLLELEWDGGREQRSAMLDELPLLVRW